jgi:hypothetical protein
MSLKLGTGLGVLALVLVGSFYLNDIIRIDDRNSAKSLTEGGRDLASLQPLVGSSLGASKTFVSKLAESEGLDKAQKGQRPSDFDKFAFEELQGRYSVELKSGKIKSFHFDAQTNSNPLTLPKPIEFLNSYKALWSIKFDSIKKTHSSASNKETYDLSDQVNKKVGSVVFEKDENGLWQSLEFIQK